MGHELQFSIYDTPEQQPAKIINSGNNIAIVALFSFKQFTMSYF